MPKEYDLHDYTDKIMTTAELKDNFTETIDQLAGKPVILTEDDKPKAVLLSFEKFMAMEGVLEHYFDLELSRIAAERLSEDAETIDHETMVEWLLSDAPDEDE